MPLQSPPVARAQMLIRKPGALVFEARGDGATFVRITASGFSGTDDEQVAQAIDAMGGFSLTLAACKAWLEHGIELNVVLDHDPDAHVKHE